MNELKQTQLAHIRMNGYVRTNIRGYEIYRRPDGGQIECLSHNKWTVWRDGADEPPVDRIVKELNEWDQVTHK